MTQQTQNVNDSGPSIDSASTGERIMKQIDQLIIACGQLSQLGYGQGVPFLSDSFCNALRNTRESSTASPSKKARN